MRIKLTIALLIITATVKSQIAFYNTYASSSFDEGHGLVQLADSSYLITGSTASFTGFSDIFVTHLTKNGTFDWSKQFGGENNDRGRRIFYDDTTGIWCFGTSNSPGAQSYDFYMANADEFGNQQWETFIGTSDWEYLSDAIRLVNGDFILTGQSSGSNSLGDDGYLARVDMSGSIVWEIQLQTAEDDKLNAIANLNDSVFVIGGQSFNGDTQAAFLLAFSIDGDTLWHQYYEPLLVGEIHGISIFENEIYAVGGLTGTGETKPDLWMLRTDSQGNIIYDHLDVRDETAYFSKVQMVGDGRLYTSLISDSPSFNPFTNGVDFFFMKYHQNLFWNGVSQSFSGVNDDMVHQMIQTNDNGIALIGTVSDDRTMDSPGTHITVIKIGPSDEIVPTPTTDQLVSIKPAESTEISVYPNPFNEYVNINMPAFVKGNFEIIGLDGRIVLNGTLNNNQIATDQLKDGIYMLKIKLGGELITKKLLKASK